MKIIVQKLKLRTVWPYIVIIVAALIVCYPSLHLGVGYGDDLIFHIYRYHSVIDGLKDHQLLPQLDPWAVNGFGHSWNLFYGPLSAYLVTALRFVTPSWAVAVNTFIIISVIASGIFMYRFIMDVSKRRLLGVFAAILFMTAPYHMTDIYVRQAHGELLAFVFIPIVFHGLYKIIHRSGGRALTIVGLTGLLLSHNLSTMMVVLFAAMYAALNIRRIIPNFKEFVKSTCIVLLFVVGLTSFFTLPMLEAKATGVYNIFDKTFAANYMGMSAKHLESWSLTAHQLIVNPNPVRTTLDVMPFALGGITIVSLVVFLLSIKLIPKKERSFVISMFCLGLVALIFTTKLIPWSVLPHAVYAIQFPWRFLMLADFFFAIAGAYGIYFASHYVFKRLRISQYLPLLIIPLLIACVASSHDILSFGQSRSRWDGTYSYSDDISAPILGISGNEYAPRDKAAIGNRVENRIPAYLRQNGRQPAFLDGAGTIGDYSRVGSHAQFSVKVVANKAAAIILPDFYYPGYQASIVLANGSTKQLVVSCSDKGFLTLHLAPTDNGVIHVKYGTSKATAAGVLITVMTLISAFIVIRRRK